jgi:hypothetical protein
MPRRKIAAAAAVVLAAAGLAAAQPADALVVRDAAGHDHALAADTLAALPASEVQVDFASAHGPFHGVMHGPSLWSVLLRAGAVPAGQPRAEARLAVVVTGRDGYTSVIALGEIAPELANKPVLLATGMDGKPLGAGHLRLAVPGDAHGARNVHDVARVAVVDVPGPAP